ncbi:hypothetical protein HGA34_04605 [Candidatus Falkowbacteria bacterium]|nr:hypothetical protein [Candidatus Falkowbacteria bacterium]
MKQESLKEIIEGLRQDEVMESQMIGLYLTLLDVGIDGCLPEDKRPGFRQALTQIQQESIRHKEAVQGLIKKYDV